MQTLPYISNSKKGLEVCRTTTLASIDIHVELKISKGSNRVLETLPFTEQFMTRISFSCIVDKTESLKIKYVDKFRWDTKTCSEMQKKNVCAKSM